MVNWLKQYYLWIIIGLSVMLCLQTCRSCATKNTLQWSEVEQSTMRDSLVYLNNLKDKKIDSLQYELNKIQSKYEASRSIIDGLNKDKEYLKDQNKTLNSNLKKTLDKNEKSE